MIKISTTDFNFQWIVEGAVDGLAGAATPAKDWVLVMVGGESWIRSVDDKASSLRSIDCSVSVELVARSDLRSRKSSSHCLCHGYRMVVWKMRAAEAIPKFRYGSLNLIWRRMNE